MIPLAPAHLRDRALSPDPFQHDADLLFGGILASGDLAVAADQGARRLPRPGGEASFHSGRIFFHGSLLLKTAQSSAGWEVNQGRNYSLFNLTQPSHFRFHEKGRACQAGSCSDAVMLLYVLKAQKDVGTPPPDLKFVLGGQAQMPS